MNRKGFLLIIFTLFFFSSSHLKAEQILLGKNILLDDMLVQLDSKFYGMRIPIFWKSENGIEYSKFVYIRDGIHNYDLRHYPEWRGKAQYVIISHHFVTAAKLIPANLENNKDTSSFIEYLELSSVNLRYGTSILGIDTLLLISYIFTLVLGMLGITTFLKKKKIPLPIIILGALFSTFLFIDIQSYVEHSDTIRMSPRHFGINFAKSLKNLATDLSPKIQKDSWTLGSKVIWPYTTRFRYELAEKHYIADNINDATYLIDMDAGNQLQILAKTSKLEEEKEKQR